MSKKARILIFGSFAVMRQGNLIYLIKVSRCKEYNCWMIDGVYSKTPACPETGRARRWIMDVTEQAGYFLGELFR